MFFFIFQEFKSQQGLKSRGRMPHMQKLVDFFHLKTSAQLQFGTCYEKYERLIFIICDVDDLKHFKLCLLSDIFYRTFFVGTKHLEILL